MKKKKNKMSKIEIEKNAAYREYVLRKSERLSVSNNLNPWFELFNYRTEHNENPLTGKKERKNKMTTRKELQQICKKRKIPGWYKMNKAELEKAVKKSKTTSKPKLIKKSKKFKNFDEFFNWFKYEKNIKDLKLSYGHDYRKNEDFDTGEKYLEIFMDYDFKKVKKGLENVSNLKFVKKRNYRIYLMKK